MASEKGFPSKERETSRDVPQDHVTAQPIREKQWGKDVVAHLALVSISTDAVEADSSKFLIKATAHSAKVGDVIKFTSGNLVDQEVKVIKVSTDSFELGELLSEAPAISDTFEIFRHTYLQATSDGSLNVNAVQTPIKYVLDGVDTEVTEDTVTPANNRPLPVKLTGDLGDISFNASNLNLDVQLDHDSANPDSVQIGDGTETLSITASGEAETSDSSTHTKLDLANVSLDSIELDMASLEAKDFATETTLSSLNSKDFATELTLSSIDGKDFATQTTLAAINSKDFATETTLAALAAEDFASETTLASLEGKDFATQTTLAALLTELEAKADLSETQPISAASLPLPTGASTAAKQDDVITQLTSIAGEDFATETTLAALAAEDFATSAKQDSIITELQSIVAEQSLDVLEFARHDYGATPVTTAAYTELVASTGASFKELQIFDSSGQTLVVAIGAAASEVDKLYIFPGGNGNIKAQIPSGSRISIKAVSATADAGELSVNFLG